MSISKMTVISSGGINGHLFLKDLSSEDRSSSFSVAILLPKVRRYLRIPLEKKARSSKENRKIWVPEFACVGRGELTFNSCLKQLGLKFCCIKPNEPRHSWKVL